MICARWSNRRRGAIRNRRCCGLARACASSARACATWATRGRRILHKLDYHLQANRKTREGSHNPDRDAQFHYINDRVKEALAAGEPAISVDTHHPLSGRGRQRVNRSHLRHRRRFLSAEGTRSNYRLHRRSTTYTRSIAPPFGLASLLIRQTTMDRFVPSQHGAHAAGGDRHRRIHRQARTGAVN
jgi:Rhodopirellula transposase DDE domain